MKILIIGTGIAGITAAIEADHAGFDVQLVTKSVSAADSASRFAQGGIVYTGPGDSSEKLEQDILTAGAGMSFPAAVRTVAEEGPQAVADILINLAAVPFSKSGKKYNLTGEAAHSVKRILYSGDTSGETIITAMLRYLETHTRVKVETGKLAIDLITIPHHARDPLAVYKKSLCVGAYIYSVADKKVSTVLADRVILACGGMGRIYKNTTNPELATGDGIAMAYRGGCRIVNMEYTQFHPTTLAAEGADNFLISEAVRGEGGVLLNHKGRDFTRKYDKRGSLAPRDIVTRAIVEEMEQSDRPYVYLSLEKIKKTSIARRFPTIYRTCREFKIDITREPIPVIPAFHFSCGGILTDLHGRSSLPGLYAVGETACTGVHGANRLASISLLEGLVFARRAVKKIKKEAEDRGRRRRITSREVLRWNDTGIVDTADPVLLKQDYLTLKQIMWNYVGITRKTRRMLRAYDALSELRSEVNKFYMNVKVERSLVELRNSIQTAIIVTSHAIKNKVSAGCHYRVD